MRRLLLVFWLTALIGLGLGANPALARGQHGTPPSAGSPGWVDPIDLPEEARATLRLIEQRGPFPYPRDGIVFGNYENLLPAQPRGYYREYTVPTPGIRHRGARRIVHGGEAHSGENYYSADHYRSFRRIRP
mgnify:FL=1